MEERSEKSFFFFTPSSCSASLLELTPLARLYESDREGPPPHLYPPSLPSHQTTQRLDDDVPSLFPPSLPSLPSLRYTKIESKRKLTEKTEDSAAVRIDLALFGGRLGGVGAGREKGKGKGKDANSEKVSSGSQNSPLKWGGGDRACSTSIFLLRLDSARLDLRR